MMIEYLSQQTMEEIGSYNTLGDTQNLVVKGDFVFLADGENGMNVLNISNPKIPELEGVYSTDNKIVDIQVDRGIAYIAANLSGLRVINMVRQVVPYGMIQIPNRYLNHPIWDY